MRIYTFILLSTLLLAGSHRYNPAGVNIAFSPSTEVNAYIANGSTPVVSPERGSGRDKENSR